jgi:hypothetical protein
MPEYRFYPLDAGRLARPAPVFVCENDREAIESAKRLMSGHAEVWDGAGSSPPFGPAGRRAPSS